MQFLLHIEVTWPPDGDPGEKDRRIAAEALRARELAAEGVIKRLWRIPGQWATWGLWEAADATALHAAITSLPMWPYLDVEVFPLADHPNDPGSRLMSEPTEDGLTIPPDYVATLFDIAGRVAVITGGGSGLGRAIAIGYAQAGVHVVAADVSDEGAAETVRLIADQGHAAEPAHLDVTQRGESEALADAVVDRHGRVDILVNSAGSAFRSPVEDFPEDKLDFILDLNLKGTYLASQAFGRKMLTQGKGSIINLASIGSFVAYPWASAYLASKGGVLGITRAMALEWRDRGVRVNGIGPTLMDSPLTRQAAQRTSITADFIKARMLRPRLGLPRELIGAAIFLASDASELVTGHTVMCDDGYLTA